MQSTSLAVQLSFSEFYVAAVLCFLWPSETGRCLRSGISSYELNGPNAKFLSSPGKCSLCSITKVHMFLRGPRTAALGLLGLPWCYSHLDTK